VQVRVFKNFGTSPAAIFADARRIEKLIKAEGLFIVKLTRASIQVPKGVTPFRCLSFTTEFVGTSFDATPGFSVLKNGPGGLRDFPGHFLGSGREGRLVFAWFGGPEARGGSFGVTKPKRDILVAI
jgi:hypothetical protein